jgi:hypothetical protein
VPDGFRAAAYFSGSSMALRASAAFLVYRKIGFILFEIARVIPLLQETVS